MVLEDDLGYHDSSFGKVSTLDVRTSMIVTFADGHSKYMIMSARDHMCKTFYARNDGTTPDLRALTINCPAP